MKREVVEHVAARAWQELHFEDSVPERVEILKSPDHKSGVYRLVGVGPTGSVIAKHTERSVIAREGTVYKKILPELPFETLACYGSLEEQNTGRGWIFIEDADGVAYSHENSLHRVLSAKWLAGLHVSAEKMRADVKLPARDLAYYMGLLHATRLTVASALLNPSLPDGGQDSLLKLEQLCMCVERRWSFLESAWSQMPITLVRGGFTGKNAHVSERNGLSVLLPFDWESAGWGIPGVDLAYIDLAMYANHVKSHWPQITLEAITTVANIGRLLWALKSIPGEASSLQIPWPHHALRKISFYSDEIQQSCKILGWDIESLEHQQHSGRCS